MYPDTKLAPINGSPMKIEELRLPSELPHHWILRKEFLQVYQDKFEPDRLICLSNIFVNVECMGLSYSSEVMKLIKELGTKIKSLEKYRYQLAQDEEELPRKRHSGHVIRVNERYRPR